jgi:hypothetical protein
MMTTGLTIVHALPSTSVPHCHDRPLVQREAADAERILESLMWASAVAVDGDGEAMNAESCHQQIPL